MSLKAQITDDMKAAMRAKDSDRLGTIRLLTAAIKQREVDERVELDDAAVVGVIDKMVKQRKDSIAAFEQGGRADLASKEAAEMAVLQAYLPQRLSNDEIATAINAMVAELSAELGRTPTVGDIGKLMGVAKSRLAGQADMAQVSAVVKAALAG